MRTIQHDTQSLRHQAIQRYLRTRSRIDRQFHKATVLIILSIILAASLIALLTLRPA